MSAHIVNPRTINALCSFATNLEKETFSFLDSNGISHNLTAEQLAKELWAANYVSVNCRYPNKKEDAPTFKFKHDLTFFNGRALWALKCLDYLAYQCSEIPNWQTTNACRMIEAMRKKFITKLIGYNDAPWGL